MKSKYDNLKLGIILGIIGPIIGFVIMFFTKFGHLTFSGFIDQLVHMRVFSKVLSLSVVPNLLFFFIFIWTNRMRSARGVLTATIIFAVLVLIAKMFL